MFLVAPHKEAEARRVRSAAHSLTASRWWGRGVYPCAPKHGYRGSGDKWGASEGLSQEGGALPLKGGGLEGSRGWSRGREGWRMNLPSPFYTWRVDSRRARALPKVAQFKKGQSQLWLILKPDTVATPCHSILGDLGPATSSPNPAPPGHNRAQHSKRGFPAGPSEEESRGFRVLAVGLRVYPSLHSISPPVKWGQ